MDVLRTQSSPRHDHETLPGTSDRPRDPISLVLCRSLFVGLRNVPSHLGPDEALAPLSPRRGGPAFGHHDRSNHSLAPTSLSGGDNAPGDCPQSRECKRLAAIRQDRFCIAKVKVVVSVLGSALPRAGWASAHHRRERLNAEITSVGRGPPYYNCGRQNRTYFGAFRTMVQIAACARSDSRPESARNVGTRRGDLRRRPAERSALLDRR